MQVMKQIDVSRVDLNLLTTFEILYQECSDSTAAERMFIGQPNLCFKKLSQKGLQRKVILGCSRFTALLDMLKGQELISIVPELLIHLEAALGLAHCEPPIPVADFSIGMAWRKSDGSSPLLSWLRGLMVDVVVTELNSVGSSAALGGRL